MNKKGVNYTSPRGSSVTNTKPSSIKQNEYLKSLTNLEALKVPVVKRSETGSQANTDLSLQFRTSSSSKAGGEAVGSKMLLSECLEDDQSQNGSASVKKTQLYRRSFAEFNNETQKKHKTLPRLEKDASDCSVIESLSGISASSYEVIRVIGEKNFWKMRTYMIKFVFLSLFL